MKIGILDFDHYTHICTMCQIFDYNNNEIFIFADELINEQLKNGLQESYNRYNITIKNKDESVGSYFKRIKRFINENKIEILFINTLSSDYFSYMYLFASLKAKKVLTIHSTNIWFQKRNRKTLGDMLFILQRKIILNQVDCIHVFGENIKQYVMDNFKFNKIMCNIPFSLFKEKEVIEDGTDKIKIVVPGNIEERRRDYDLVLDVFEELFKTYKKDLELILLGTPYGDYGKRIQGRCDNLIKQNADIVYYNSFVPPADFEKIMSSSSVILSPLQIEIYFGRVLEIYGTSKSSGSIYDIISYAKPGIFPEKFKYPRELSGNVLHYKDGEELKKVIIKILEDRAYYGELKRNALNNSKRFELEPVRKRIENDINEFIK